MTSGFCIGAPEKPGCCGAAFYKVSLVKSAAWGLIPFYEKFLGQLMPPH